MVADQAGGWDGLSVVTMRKTQMENSMYAIENGLGFFRVLDRCAREVVNSRDR